jgi:hypothetical protein
MGVRLYLNERLVGEGRLIELVEGNRMQNGFNSPGEIKIEMTTQLSSKVADTVLIDNGTKYKIDLDDIFDYSIGSVIRGNIYNKRKL